MFWRHSPTRSPCTMTLVTRCPARRPAHALKRFRHWRAFRAPPARSTSARHGPYLRCFLARGSPRRLDADVLVMIRHRRPWRRVSSALGGRIDASSFHGVLVPGGADGCVSRRVRPTRCAPLRTTHDRSSNRPRCCGSCAITMVASVPCAGFPEWTYLRYEDWLREPVAGLNPTSIGVLAWHLVLRCAIG